MTSKSLFGDDIFVLSISENVNIVDIKQISL